MARAGRKPTPETNPGHRTCKWCGWEKPYSEMRSRQGKHGLIVENTCTPCAAKKAREWYWADPDRAREKTKRWRLENHDKKLAYQRYWVSNNKAHISRKDKERSDNLTDSYVRGIITKVEGGPKTMSNSDVPQALVEAKRIQLMILRSVKDEKCK